MLVIIIIVSIGVFVIYNSLSNSNEEKEKKHQDLDKFIGEWIETTTYGNNVTWAFYQNNSIRYTTYPGITPTYYWGEFSLKGDILDIDAMPFKSMMYTFEFLDNNNKIILTSEYGGDQKILNKIN